MPAASVFPKTLITFILVETVLVPTSLAREYPHELFISNHIICEIKSRKTYFRFLMTNSQSMLARYKYQHQNPSLIIYSLRISISFQLLSTYRTVLHSRSSSRKKSDFPAKFVWKRRIQFSIHFRYRFSTTWTTHDALDKLIFANKFYFVERM